MGIWSNIIEAVPALVGAYSTYQQSQAQQDAYGDIRDTALQNVDFIAEMGAKGSEEIDAALQKALGYDPSESSKYIQTYADIGGDAYQQALNNILSGEDTSAYTEAISGAGGEAVGGRQEFRNLDPAIQDAVQTESDLVGSTYQPAMNQALLGIGDIGRSASGDIAGTTMRKSQTFGDMERNAALQKANALMGQVAPTLSQMQTGNEARLLSDISQKQMINDLLGQGAYYAGSQNWGS